MCTCGPALATPERIAEVLRLGVRVVRINFSHGGPADHERYCAAIRRAGELAGVPVRVMGDIQGPKFRVGEFEAEVRLAEGQEYLFDADPAPGDARRCPLPHPELFAACRPGAEIILNDGLVRLRARECGPAAIRATVTRAGPVGSRKGISLPGAYVKTEFPTRRDMESLATAARLGIEVVMLSFVQTAADVEAVRAVARPGTELVAKIETPAAEARLAEIAAAADAVLVARGDLGVEGGLAALPGRQKRVVRHCVAAGVRVYSATQHLESLVAGAAPTYAECADVQALVRDGAHGILLTGETASGADPARAVGWLRRLVEASEPLR